MIVKEVYSILSIITQNIVIYIHECNYTTPHSILILYDNVYIRPGKPWGSLTSTNVRLKWQSHTNRLSIKLPKQLRSDYMCTVQTGIRTLDLVIASPKLIPLRDWLIGLEMRWIFKANWQSNHANFCEYFPVVYNLF